MRGPDSNKQGESYRYADYTQKDTSEFFFWFYFTNKLLSPEVAYGFNIYMLPLMFTVITTDKLAQRRQSYFSRMLLTMKKKLFWMLNEQASCLWTKHFRHTFSLNTLRGASFLVLSCSFSMCFFCPFSILITLFGEEGAGLCAYRAFAC